MRKIVISEEQRKHFFVFTTVVYTLPTVKTPTVKPQQQPTSVPSPDSENVEEEENDMAAEVREQIMALLEKEPQTPSIIRQLEFLERDLARLEAPPAPAQGN